MGQSQSDKNSRIVIENEEDIKVSRDVLKRLKGNENSRPQSAGINSEQLKSLEADLQDRLKALEEQALAAATKNLKIAEEQFKIAVEETEQKFLKVTGSPVCSDLQQEVFQCYKKNPEQTLNCAKVSNAFVECVDTARLNASSKFR